MRTTPAGQGAGRRDRPDERERAGQQWPQHEETFSVGPCGTHRDRPKQCALDAGNESHCGQYKRAAD